MSLKIIPLKCSSHLSGANELRRILWAQFDINYIRKGVLWGPLDQILGTLLLTWINLILAWIINYIHNKMRDAITYSFPKLIGATVEAGELKNNFIPRNTGHVITYPCCD